jgi:TRAP-type C4-dicarboxylate transport system permease small subunit
MQAVSRAYGRLIDALAVIAAAMLALITVLIVADVSIRNLGFQPYPHTLALTEYSLLYMTMLGSPWLVRNKGHIHIEILVGRLRGGARRIAHAFVCLVCIAVCAMLAWYSLDVTLTNLARGETDIRSFDSPRWILVACMPLGFGLMVIEFARFLLGYDDLFESAGVYE